MHIDSNNNYEDILDALVQPITDTLVFDDYFSFRNVNSAKTFRWNALNKVGEHKRAIWDYIKETSNRLNERK
jgi:hypothetical protein